MNQALRRLSLAGGGGADPATVLRPYLPVISGAPTADPGDVVSGSATSLGDGLFRVTTQNETVVSRLPAAMAIWEIPIVDLLGNTIADLDLGELVQLWLWAESTTAPTDVILAFGLSAGAVAATTALSAGAMQAGLVTGGRWCALNAGTVGASYTAATADNALTRGVVHGAIPGTAASQARSGTFCVDASKAIITTTNSLTATGQFAGQSSYDRMFVGVGWATGSGGTPATIDIGCAALILRGREVVPSVLPFP